MTKICGTTSTCASPRALWTTTTSRSSETTSTSALFPVSPPLLFSSSSPTLWPPSYQDASLLSASQRNPSLTLSFSKILPSPLSPRPAIFLYFLFFVSVSTSMPSGHGCCNFFITRFSLSVSHYLWLLHFTQALGCSASSLRFPRQLRS